MSKLVKHLLELGLRPAGDEFRPISGRQLTAVEAYIDGRLPADYREVVAHVGDAFIHGISRVGHQRLPLGVIFGGGRGRNSLSSALGVYRGRVPGNTIPIADAYGDLFLLGFAGKDRGKVFYWDHTKEPPDPEDYEAVGKPVPKRRLYQNVTLVADSFKDFVHLIRIEPEEPPTPGKRKRTPPPWIRKFLESQESGRKERPSEPGSLRLPAKKRVSTRRSRKTKSAAASLKR